MVSHREGIAPLSSGLEADIRDFFSKPIPRAVWDEGRPFRDRKLREHVEMIIARR